MSCQAFSDFSFIEFVKNTKITSDRSAYCIDPVSSSMYDHRHTPFSSLGQSTFPSHSTLLRFSASSRKFYLVQQSVLQPGLGLRDHSDLDPLSASTHTDALTDSQRNFIKLKTSQESRGLVEQCVVHKVRSQDLLH